MTDNFGRADAKFGDVTYYIDGEARTASAVTKLLQDLKKDDDDTSGVSDAGVLTGAYVDADRDASIGDRTGGIAHRCATGAKDVSRPIQGPRGTDAKQLRPVGRSCFLRKVHRHSNGNAPDGRRKEVSEDFSRFSVTSGQPVQET